MEQQTTRTGRGARRAGVAALALAIVASQGVSVTVAAASTPQRITFSLPASALVGSTQPLTATADSGLAVSFAGSTPAVCTISDGTLALLATGTCTVTASQAGDETFAPAPEVEASMRVEPVPQGVDLGDYAVNGTVHAAVTDSTSGRT